MENDGSKLLQVLSPIQDLLEIDRAQGFRWSLSLKRSRSGLDADVEVQDDFDGAFSLRSQS